MMVSPSFAVGSCVKISRNMERFWVEVMEAWAEGWFFGRVDNHLVNPHPYKKDDVIEFHKDEVIDVMHC